MNNERCDRLLFLVCSKCLVFDRIKLDLIVFSFTDGNRNDRSIGKGFSFKIERKDMNPTPMASLIADLQTVVTALFTIVGTICTTIVGEPLLLLTVGVLLCGAAVGIFGRLLSRN